MADTIGLPPVGEIVELEAVGKSGRGTMRFEVIAVDPQALGWKPRLARSFKLLASG